MKKLPGIRRPSWDAVLLVCRDCRKRGGGPKDFKLKPALHQARRALKATPLRARVVASSCLGLCPKQALAVALAGGAGGTAIAAVASVDELGPALASLVAMSGRSS